MSMNVVMETTASQAASRATARIMAASLDRSIAINPFVFYGSEELYATASRE